MSSVTQISDVTSPQSEAPNHDQKIRVRDKSYNEPLTVTTAPLQCRAGLIFLQAHPTVGKLVRILRLEGTYTDDLSKVVQLMPCIETLYLPMRVTSATSLDNLASALPKMNPVALFMDKPWIKAGEKDAADTLVAHHIPAWR